MFCWHLQAEYVRVYLVTISFLMENDIKTYLTYYDKPEAFWFEDPSQTSRSGVLSGGLTLGLNTLLNSGNGD
jgi:hypothetical protein